MAANSKTAADVQLIEPMVSPKLLGRYITIGQTLVLALLLFVNPCTISSNVVSPKFQGRLLENVENISY